MLKQTHFSCPPPIQLKTLKNNITDSFLIFKKKMSRHRDNSGLQYGLKKSSIGSSKAKLPLKHNKLLGMSGTLKSISKS
jgi:hypothetical protein